MGRRARLNQQKRLGLQGSAAVKSTRQLTGRQRRFAQVREAVVALVEGPPPVGTQPPSFGNLRVIGTGFIADERGLVLTAGHCLDPWLAALARKATDVAPWVCILAPSEQHGSNFGWGFNMAPVMTVRKFAKHDLGLVRLVPPPSPLPVLRLATSSVMEGDVVATCGFPFGSELHERIVAEMPTITPSFSQGIVSAVAPHPLAPPELLKTFHVDVAISPGNSGGPVFDPESGNVVGVISASFGPVHKRVRVAAKEPASESTPADDSLATLHIPSGLAAAVHAHYAAKLLAEARTQFWPITPPSQAGQ